VGALVFLTACGGGKTVGEGTSDMVPEVGWIAQMTGHHHTASGVAEIIDENTIELRDFGFDGGGLNARLFLLWDGEPFDAEYELSDNLVGQDPFWEPLQLQIPDEAEMENWNLITLWCVPAKVSFGDGVFAPP